MHRSSMLRMKCFIDSYIKEANNAKILDVGSYNVNGSYKDLLKNMDVQYVGLDIENGPNVNIVINDIYNWTSIEDESYDFVISGQAFEHIEYPWLTIREIYKKLKKNGITCIIAPNSLWEHKYPYDCYRYFGDGLVALAKWAGFSIIEVSVAGIPELGVSSEWDDPSNDVCLIAGKLDESPKELQEKKIFPYERRFDIGKNYKLHYEFVNVWSDNVITANLIQQYLNKNRKNKVFIYGYEYIGERLEILLTNIGIEYEVIKTDQLAVSNRNNIARIDLFPGIISTEKNTSINNNAVMILTIFDYSRDYIRYLDKLYPHIEKYYLYDLLEFEMYAQFFESNKNIYLYGAGSYGKLIFKRLQGWNIDIAGFVVTDGLKKEKEFCGKTVYELSELKQNTAIMISIENSTEIIENLTDKGFTNIVNGINSVSVWKYSDELYGTK